MIIDDTARDETKEAVLFLIEDQKRRDEKFADGELRMRAAQDYERALSQQRSLLYSGSVENRTC